MNTKRIISLVASLALVLSLSVGLTGCGDKAAQDDNQGSTDGESTKYTVGICQLVQHEALDAATKGFKDALKDKLGDDVSFDEQNAAGDAALFRRADTTDYAEGAWDEGQKSIKVRR